MLPPSKHQMLPLFQRALGQPPTKIAIRDVQGSHSYSRLLKDSGLKSLTLLDNSPAPRIAYLGPNSYEYVMAQWATWAAGGISLPLCPSHPEAELGYILNDAGASILLSHVDYKQKAQRLSSELGIGLKVLEHPPFHSNQETVNEQNWIQPINQSLEAPALMIYTSGTTGKPKGVLLSHANLVAQMEAMEEAWAWTCDDLIHHPLPLHHIHGIVNALQTALWVGATVEFPSTQFNPAAIWERWSKPPYFSLFMGVPTMYAKLLQCSQITKAARFEACKSFRLMISGSSALPVPVLQRWEQETGHRLLERYGMTETGMIVGGDAFNPQRRVPGCVGWPFPKVQVKLWKEEERIYVDANDEAGEIHVKGPQIFQSYWKRPEATKEVFTQDGWFKTGDVGEWTEKGGLRILGRSSIDIIKSAGYKISALDIEREILSVSGILECAVIGVPDEIRGQRLVAAIVVDPEIIGQDEEEISAGIRKVLGQQLAHYKIPSKFKLTPALPRNVMGKTDKKQLMKKWEE